MLEHDEVAALVERAAGRTRVIAQIGRPSTRGTTELARRALAAGADGVAAYVPWFYPVTQVQVRQHFLALLEAADGAPAFIYNIPPRTVNDLDPALAGELASAGFAGMKDSTGDFARHEAYLDAVSGNGSFELFTGTEPLAVRSIAAGRRRCHRRASELRARAVHRPARRARRRRQGRERPAPRPDPLLKEQVKAEESTVAAIKRRVRERLARGGVDYPAAPRAPFT